jgi:hypothetical protein
MREEVENPIVKEPAHQLNIPYLDIVSEREKMPPGFEKYIEKWKEMERRDTARKTGSIPRNTGVSL